MGLKSMLSLVAFCVSSLVLGQDVGDLLELRKLSIDSTLCTLAKKGAPQNLPILSNATGRIYPTDGNNGDILIASGARFNASCASSNTVLKEFKVNQIGLQCKTGKLTVYPSGVSTSFANLGCQDALKEEVDDQTNGNCNNLANVKNISVDFNTSIKKFREYSLCHDYGQFNTLYSRHTISGRSITVAEISNNRPSFKKASFFSSSVSPATAYSQSNQREMVRQLTGSSKLADQYIDVSQSWYFARGHLSPDGDFVYASEQNSTYYYINVIPQWQAINNGNWKALEVAARKLASSHGTNLDIYTGGYGVLTLKDVNDNPVEIFLTKDSTNKLAIPAPSLTWKLIHEPSTNKAVVIVIVNNPMPLGVTSKDLVCTSICSQIKFVTWDIGNNGKGYTYCCDVASFRQTVTYAPELKGVGLLTQ